ncbi:Diacylglycerol kinase zeta, partial [Schistosoma japonicum]
KSGVKRKCSVCHIICHVNCLPLVQVSCRPTFREAYIHDYRNERTYTTHHWVRRRKQNKKCKHCGKSLQSILGFSSKEYITIQCTWCKIGYHNKSACFRESFLTQPCSLGPYSDLVVPPDWIIKLTDGNNCKSTSICRSNSFIASSHLSDNEVNISSIRSSVSRPESLNHSNQILNNLSQQESSIITETTITTVHENSQSASISQANLFVPPNVSFVIKTNPTNAACLKPLLVFLNPKSGGNQAYSLMKKFQWLLNPRQVFDLSQGGPKMGLELFSRVPNLRILVCGGDGTVGWIFSTIDSMNFNSIPPVAVLPLGTGNDLARALNWGSGYIDESISKILASVYDGRVIALDRWQVNSEVRTDFQPSQQLTDYEDDESTRNRPISDGLPLKVFNNYFSLGADAATALEFHESREANPERFNSRLKNKLFYAGLGGKDLLRRSWRDLSEHITLVCDDEDLTPLIRSLKPHCILFLNIPRYGSGTLPWGHPESEFQPQRIDDGYIEVIGLTSTTLATLQIGGHGDRICQCRRVRLTTDIVIPMQMDGEPCRLVPSVIDVFCSHQALVIQKITRPPGSAALLNEFCNGCNCLGSK